MGGIPTSLVESESSDMGPPIFGAEVAEMVKKLLSGKAPGVDEVRPEFLLRSHPHIWMTHIWSRFVGSDQKNEIANTNVRKWALP